MLLQFHHILILAITAEGMFLPHDGGDDPRTALSFTALLNGDKADYAKWNSGESFTATTDQGSKNSSPTGEALIGENIINPKGAHEPISKSHFSEDTPRTSVDNTPETSATKTTISTHHDSSQSGKNRDSIGPEASSSHGTSIGDYAGLSEDGNGENHGKSQEDTSLEHLQEPWFYEHDLMGDGVTRDEFTLLDIDLSKDSDPNSLLASWSGWDRSPEHDQGHVRLPIAGQEDAISHKLSASTSPSQSQDNPEEMYAHVSPIQTPSPQQKITTPEVNILGHKRPLIDEDSGEDMHEAKRLKASGPSSFPFDLTNSPTAGLPPTGPIRGLHQSRQGSDEHAATTFSNPSHNPSRLGNIEFPHNHQESALYGDQFGASSDRQPWQHSDTPFQSVHRDPNTEGNQNGRWKVPISFGPDVDPATEALLRATVLPSIVVPSRSTNTMEEHTVPKGNMQHLTAQDQRQISSNKHPGIPRYPKPLNPSSTVPSSARTSNKSTLLPQGEKPSVSGFKTPTASGDKNRVEISILKESFSNYLVHLLHQIPNMGFDINSVKDCILPSSLMVIKSNLHTTRKRKTLIILSQVTMYLLHLSPRNNLPGPKGDIKSAIYDDVLQWVVRIILHPDIDTSEVPLMTGCAIRQKRISPVLQNLLSDYLKDTSHSLETMKQKEMEYTHMCGAALVDEWLIGYYTDVWKKLIKVTSYNFKPENLIYKGLVKTATEPEIDQKMPLDQMKFKLGLTIHICEMIGEDSISKEIETLTNLLTSMDLSPTILHDKKIIKLLVHYQQQLIEKEKENSFSKIFKNLSIKKIMKEFILNVEDIISNGHNKSFITPWLQESLKRYLLSQEDESLNINEVKILSYSILTNFFKQVSEITVQDPALNSKFQKTLGKMSLP